MSACGWPIWWNEDGTVRRRCSLESCHLHIRRTVVATVTAPDLINEPPHYRSVKAALLADGSLIPPGKLEAMAVIEAFDLNWHVANVCKYILRAGRKGPTAEDLKKAAMYLNRAIKLAEGAGDK